MMINKKFFDGLSKEDQELILNSSQGGLRVGERKDPEGREQAPPQLQRKGMQVIIPDAESFRVKGKPAVEELFKTEWPVTTWARSLPSKTMRNEERGTRISASSLDPRSSNLLLGVSMAAEAEWKEKERRVREFLLKRGYGAVLLKRQANFCWMTCGGLNLVGITTEIGASALLITQEKKYVLSNNIEAPRMMEEEALAAQGFIGVSYPWYEEKESRP